MKFKSGDIDIMVGNELIGSAIGKEDVAGVALGLINCRNHKTGMNLIYNIAKFHQNEEVSFVNKNTLESELYNGIRKLIEEYKDKKSI